MKQKKSKKQDDNDVVQELSNTISPQKRETVELILRHTYQLLGRVENGMDLNNPTKEDQEFIEELNYDRARYGVDYGAFVRDKIKEYNLSKEDFIIFFELTIGSVRKAEARNYIFEVHDWFHSPYHLGEFLSDCEDHNRGIAVIDNHRELIESMIESKKYMWNIFYNCNPSLMPHFLNRYPDAIDAIENLEELVATIYKVNDDKIKNALFERCKPRLRELYESKPVHIDLLANLSKEQKDTLKEFNFPPPEGQRTPFMLVI